MKPLREQSHLLRRATAAFTIVEIAFALAIIGFALVAILGVLPLGLDVQKNNRRETIINQDANYFVAAIRGGARGLDDLTNYVMAITNYWTRFDSSGTITVTNYDGYDRSNSYVTSSSQPINVWPLTDGLSIIGLLSIPKYMNRGGGNYQSNYVVAYVQAISGAAMEKYPQNNEVVRESAFAYRMVAELTPFRPSVLSNQTITNGFYHPDWTNYLAANIISNSSPVQVTLAVSNWAARLALGTNANPDPVFYLTNLGVNVNPAGVNIENFRVVANQWLVSRQITTNLYDLRLLFRWPLLPGGRIGNGRQVYRAMVSGAITNEPVNGVTWFIRPDNYIQVH